MSRVQRDLMQCDRQPDERSRLQDLLRKVKGGVESIRVAIVGGGFAGLRCADVLLQHGFQVTILEARGRLGGRVAQSNHLGYKVDL